MARQTRGAAAKQEPAQAEATARRGIQSILADDVDDVLRETFFATEVPIGESTRGPGLRRAKPPQEKPEHYKVICISFYTEDLEHLDRVVKDLKKLGHTKANRSAVLREAMRQLDLTKVPRGL
ncbi:MAG: hypothetical protein JNK72_18635 [Myxococcales bacterium]|nr:hypothetical protein [Myxococcales bacterium]